MRIVEVARHLLAVTSNKGNCSAFIKQCDSSRNLVGTDSEFLGYGIYYLDMGF